MRKIAMATAALLAFTGTAFAGPKDKTSETLVNPSSINGSAEWNNTTVSTKVKSGKCKLQIQFKDATGIAGDDIVCLGEADVLSATLGVGLFGNSVVIQGTVEADGKFKAKANLGAIGCGILDTALAMNGGTRCYQATVGTGVGEYDWAAACSGAGMAPIGANVLPGTEDINGDAVVGICQGLVANAGQRINPPAANPLLVQGSYQPVAP
jgi:hypothetical protein